MEFITETPLASAKASCKLFPHWELTEERPCSISGVKLDGEKLVRFVYLDESGISINEVVTVVAGVIVDADNQWKAVEKGIDDLIVRSLGATGPATLPRIIRAAYVLHASDMFHGRGPLFNQQLCSLERSHNTLKELLAIPSLFGLPVVFGYIRKEPYQDTSKSAGQRRREIRDSAAINQSLAFTLCAVAAEQYMRTLADPTEIATLVAENNPQTAQALKTVHDLLRGSLFPDSEMRLWSSEYLKLGPDYLPLRKIVDAVHFQEKNDAYLLQIADACAVIIRYFIEEKRNTGAFVDAFTQGDPTRISRWIAPGSQAGLGLINFKPPLA